MRDGGGMLEWLLLIHTGATLAMTGLIWFVQVVHYPLFAGVGEAGFAAYAALHGTRTTLVVAPLMLLELASGLLLLSHEAVRADWRAWAGMGLLAFVWLVTFFVQVPQHGRLGQGFDAATVAALVRGNWLRTGAWTLRSALLLWVLRDQMRAPRIP